MFQEKLRLNDMSRVIIYGFFLIAYAGVSVCNLNLSLHKAEMVEIFNRINAINSSWGKAYDNTDQIY